MAPGHAGQQSTQQWQSPSPRSHHTTRPAATRSGAGRQPHPQGNGGDHDPDNKAARATADGTFRDLHGSLRSATREEPEPVLYRSKWAPHSARNTPDMYRAIGEIAGYTQYAFIDDLLF